MERIVWGHMGECQTKSSRKRASRLAMLVFIPWTAVILYGLNDWASDIARSRRALTTFGTITAIEENNHHQRDYTYQVGATAYKGSCVICAEDKSPGSGIVVSYDPFDPSRSTLTDFATEGARPIPLILCVALAFLMYFRLRAFLLRHIDGAE